MNLYELQIGKYLLEHPGSDEILPSNIQGLKIELVFSSEMTQRIKKSPLYWFVIPCVSIAHTTSFPWFSI